MTRANLKQAHIDGGVQIINFDNGWWRSECGWCIGGEPAHAGLYNNDNYPLRGISMKEILPGYYVAKDIYSDRYKADKTLSSQKIMIFKGSKMILPMTRVHDYGICDGKVYYVIGKTKHIAE